MPPEAAAPSRPTARYQRAPLYPAQEKALFGPERWSITAASTKAGKTSGAIVWLSEKAILGGAGQNFWWVAPVYPQAEIAFRRMCAAIPRDYRAINESKLTITLANRTVIWFKSGEKPDNLFGEDVYAAVVDEASRLREEAFHAIRTTLSATKGQCRFIGNVKGRRNWFFRLGEKAKNGERDMAFHRLTWRDAVAAGILDLAEVEDARRMLPPVVFQELYEAEPGDDQGNPFGIGAIAECVQPAMSGDPPVAWGVDLGKRQDWVCAVGLDRQGRVCRFLRWQKSWRDTKADLLAAIDHAPALVDSTGVGDPILEDLQHAQANIEGFVFTTKSKQALMEKLRDAIQHRRVGVIEGVLRSELEQFEYEYTRLNVLYSAPEGCHDDAVCGLALAWWHREAVGVNAAFRHSRVRADSTPEGSQPMTANGRWPVGREIIL